MGMIAAFVVSLVPVLICIYGMRTRFHADTYNT